MPFWATIQSSRFDLTICKTPLTTEYAEVVLITGAPAASMMRQKTRRCDSTPLDASQRLLKRGYCGNKVKRALVLDQT